MLLILLEKNMKLCLTGDFLYKSCAQSKGLFLTDQSSRTVISLLRKMWLLILTLQQQEYMLNGLLGE